MQMLSYLLGQGVFGFVDGSNTCPSSHILAGDGISLQVNPLSSLETTGPTHSECSSFLPIYGSFASCCWLSKLYFSLAHSLASSCSTSNSRIVQLHSSLQDLRQGDESVTQFMQKAKALFDELVTASRLVSLEDFNLCVSWSSGRV